MPIPVREEGGGYEIKNGLLGINGSINFKLTERLNEAVTKMVFSLFKILLICLKVVWGEF
jgi:hypothetical protein